MMHCVEMNNTNRERRACCLVYFSLYLKATSLYSSIPSFHASRISHLSSSSINEDLWTVVLIRLSRDFSGPFLNWPEICSCSSHSQTD